MSETATTAAPAATPAAPVEAPVSAPKAAEDASKSTAAGPNSSKDAPKDAAPAEAPPAPKKYKVKVDDAEQEVTEEELLRGYQTKSAADKRFREAAEARKEVAAQRQQVNEFLEFMKSNPAEFASRAMALGIDPVKLAEDILRPEVEKQVFEEEKKSMTPEQLEALELKAKLAEYEKKEAAQKAAEKKAEDEKKAAAQQAAIDKETHAMSDVILGALKELNVPNPTPDLALEMVDQYQIALERGLPLDAKALAADLVSRKREEARRYATPETLSPELEEAVWKKLMADPKRVEEVRKAAVAEFKANNPMVAAKPATGKPNPRLEAKSSGKTFAQTARELALEAGRRR